MKRNRGKEPETESHEEEQKKRTNKNEASQSLALPEQLSEHRRDFLSDNLSSSPSAARNSTLEPSVADSLSMTDNELLSDDANLELTPDLVTYLENEISLDDSNSDPTPDRVTYVENELTDPNMGLTPDLADFVCLLNNVIPSDDQAPSTVAAASNSKTHPKLANSGSMVKNDPFVADPHPLASTSSSVQLQPQQTEHQSLIREGREQEQLDRVKQLLLSDDSKLPPNLANSGSVVKNDPLLADPHPLAATSSSVQLQSQQTDHQNLTRGGLLQEQVHHDRVKQLLLSNDSYLADSSSVVENDKLLIHPHPAAAISTSVQLQPQQPERLSLTSGGLQLLEDLDWSEVHQLSYGSASSSASNNYTVEATDKDSRTVRFEITHRSSLEEVRTEIARRFEMERLSFWMENADGNAADQRVMLNDRDLSRVIVQATSTGSRLIRLKVYKSK